jgi:ketosteroid isomerase-like protein
MENLEAVRRVYDEWGRGNFRPRFDFYADEMEWGWSDDFPGLAGVYRDPAERNKRLAEWLGPWEHWVCQAEDYVVHGDHVVALCRYRGRGKGSGATVDTKGAHVWTLRAGRCVRLVVFADRAKALASVGLTDQATAGNLPPVGGSDG